MAATVTPTRLNFGETLPQARQDPNNIPCNIHFDLRGNNNNTNRNKTGDNDGSGSCTTLGNGATTTNPTNTDAINNDRNVELVPPQTQEQDEAYGYGAVTIDTNPHKLVKIPADTNQGPPLTNR